MKGDEVVEGGEEGTDAALLGKRGASEHRFHELANFDVAAVSNSVRNKNETTDEAIGGKETLPELIVLPPLLFEGQNRICR